MEMFHIVCFPFCPVITNSRVVTTPVLSRAATHLKSFVLLHVKGIFLMMEGRTYERKTGEGGKRDGVMDEFRTALLSTKVIQIELNWKKRPIFYHSS